MKYNGISLNPGSKIGGSFPRRFGSVGVPWYPEQEQAASSVYDDCIHSWNFAEPSAARTPLHGTVYWEPGNYNDPGRVDTGGGDYAVLTYDETDSETRSSLTIGSDQQVRFFNAGAWSLSLPVKLLSTDASHDFFELYNQDNGGGFGLRTRYGDIQAYFNNGSSFEWHQLVDPVETDTEYTIFLGYNPDTGLFYYSVDGAPKTAVSVNPVTNPDGAFARMLLGWGYYTAQFRSLAIWDRVLSDAEVLEAHQNRLNDYEQPTPQAPNDTYLGAPAYNVALAPYNAAGDGATDDGDAIRQCFADAEYYAAYNSTDIVARFPAGDYYISPALEEDVYCYKVRTGRIRLVGDGEANTKVYPRCFGNLDPETNWRVLGWGLDYAKISRPHLLEFPNYTVRDVYFEDMTLDGGCEHSGNADVGGRSYQVLATDSILGTTSAHGLTNGTRLRFPDCDDSDWMSPEIVPQKSYFVVNATEFGFQIADAPMGAAITLSDTSNRIGCTDGTGWCMEHGILKMGTGGSYDNGFTRCTIRRCRGEGIHGGGNNLGTLHLNDCLLEICDASILSCPSVIANNCTFRSSYNGVENFGRSAHQESKFINCIFADATLTYLGFRVSSLEVGTCSFTNAGIHLASMASNVQIHHTDFTDITRPIYTSTSTPYPDDPAAEKVFQNITIEDNNYDNCGSFFDLYTRDIKDLIVRRNTAISGSPPAVKLLGSLSLDNVRGVAVYDNVGCGTAVSYDGSTTQHAKFLCWNNDSNSYDRFYTYADSLSIIPRDEFAYIHNFTETNPLPLSLSVDPALVPDGWRTQLYFAGNAGKQGRFSPDTWNDLSGNQDLSVGDSAYWEFHEDDGLWHWGWDSTYITFDESLARRHVGHDRELTFKTVNSTDLKLYVRDPEGTPEGVILIYHGGGWTGGEVSMLEAQAEHYRRKGWITALVDYRLAQDDASVTIYDSLYDAYDAFYFARDNITTFHASLTGSDIVVMGESAGGHLAACVGYVPDPRSTPGQTWPKGCILANAALDLYPLGWKKPGLDFGADVATSNLISPMAHVSAGKPPAILIHGASDTVIPVSQSVDFGAALTSAGISNAVQQMTGKDHGFFMWYLYDYQDFAAIKAATGHVDSWLGSLV